MKKSSFIPAVVLVAAMVLVGSGCASSSPESQVEDLRQAKENTMEESGFNECNRQVEEATNEYAKMVERCQLDKIKKAGYMDDIDCIENFDKEPICNDTERYNAEIFAINDCQEELKEEHKVATALTVFDCLELLEE